MKTFLRAIQLLDDEASDREEEQANDLAPEDDQEL